MNILLINGGFIQVIQYLSIKYARYAYRNVTSCGSPAPASEPMTIVSVCGEQRRVLCVGVVAHQAAPTTDITHVLFLVSYNVHGIIL